MAYVLFISQEKLVESTALNLNIDTNLLLPYVRQAQKLYVEPKLGTQLYEALKTKITAGNLTGAYKKSFCPLQAGAITGKPWYAASKIGIPNPSPWVKVTKDLIFLWV